MTTLERPPVGGFVGRVGGMTYTDRKAFEKAARRLGYGRGKLNRFRIGAPVTIHLDPLTAYKFVQGQVWSEANVKGWVWVALDTGCFVALLRTSGTVCTSPGGKHLGRAA